ncbi:MAG: hypothetical protein CUN55_12040 [Phototrophicales bacterium]|nr:MAG: hypothetical protein CUN55_12040 [Phototrophicales bacterium]
MDNTSQQRRNSAFDNLLTLYRRSIKRIYILHAATHWSVSHTLIPLLERIRRFKTIPDDPFWFRLELLLHKHEYATVAQLRQLIQPNMIALDIGAHVGYYAQFLARLVGDNGKVLAFEPHPRTFQTLSANVQRYTPVTAYPLAVSDRSGKAELYDYLLMSASGSLHFDESLRNLQQSQISEYDIAPRANHFETQTFEVDTVILDEFLPQHGITQVDFIKMDIEGAEISALRGLKQIIQNSPRLNMIMEYNPQALKAFGYDPIEALQEVMALGFSSVAMINDDATLTDLTDQQEQIVELTNYLGQNMGVVNLLFKKTS